MKTVAIVYFSSDGHNQSMAEAVAEGARAIADTEANLIQMKGEHIKDGRCQADHIIEELNKADAIVIGTPTYMGGVAAQIKALIDAAGSVWQNQGWKNKIAGGFTHSGSPSGDKQGTLLSLATHAAQQGMIWVGYDELPDPEKNRLGSFLGAMGSGHDENVNPADLKCATLYGQRLAKATHAWDVGKMG